MKSRNIRKVTMVLTTAAALTALAATVQAKTQFKFITAMSDADRSAILEYVVAQLEEKYPDVEFTNDSGSDYNNRAKLAFSSGDSYQMIYTDDLGISPLRDAGYLMEISQYIDEYGWEDRQVAGATDFYNQRTPGEKYSVGTNSAPVVVYYNKDIFEELGLDIPQTIDEYEACLKAATEAGYIGSENDKVNINGWYIQSIVQNRAPMDKVMDWYYLVDTSDEVKQAFIEAEETVKRWSDAGYFRDMYEGIEYGDVPSLFSQGQTAMSLDGNWFLYDYENSGVNVGVFAFPGRTSAEDTNYIINPVDAAFAISADCDETQLSVALDFIDLMLTPEVAEQWLAIGTLPTLNYEYADDVASPLTNEMIAAISDTEGGFYLDNVKGGFLELFQKELQRFLSGESTSEEMWDAIDAFWHED